MTNIPASFTPIESKEDLRCLIRGDTVRIIYQNEPLWKYGEQEPVIGAYHGTDFQGALEFLIPQTVPHEYLTRYTARKSYIELRDGAIIINEDKSVTKSFSKENSDYKILDETLKLAGLRD